MPSVDAMDVARIMPSSHSDREEVLLAVTFERGAKFSSADDRVLGPVSSLLPPRDAPPLVILTRVERRSRYALDATAPRSPNATVH
jgi:hypothetical protein